MILKSYIVEQNIEVLKSYQATLIYGKNYGIKEDIKQVLKDKNKNSEIIFFFEEEILKKKNILYQNIINESLFNEKKIIFVYDASDKILSQISEGLEIANNNIEIYIFSENLEKKSKLRNLFEKEKNLASFACYEDNERTLIAYVNKELKEFKGLSGEITSLIISNSSMDRGIIKSELVKIKSYFYKKTITKEEVLEILNIKNFTSFDEIRDAALNGEKKKTNQLLSEVDLQNEDAFLYLNNLNKRITNLQEIIKISEDNRNKYEHTLENFKPQIFWKDKPLVMKQLKKWSAKKLSELAQKIAEAELVMKRNSYLQNEIVIKNLIISFISKASSTYS